MSLREIETGNNLSLTLSKLVLVSQSSNCTMRVPLCLFCFLVGIGLAACATSRGDGVSDARPKPVNAESIKVATRNSVPVVHVFVALCDNVNQGIVPVSASLGKRRQSGHEPLLGSCVRRQNILQEEQELGTRSRVSKPAAGDNGEVGLQT
jgi:hypothetical protein